MAASKKKSNQCQLLGQKIARWLNKHNDPNRLQTHMHLRALSTSLQIIANRSSSKLIHYLLLKALSFLFTDDNTSIQLNLSHEIKEQYRKWLMEQYKSNRNLLELFVLYQINLTALFISQHYDSISIDSNLKGQLCVILYHSLLGISVGEGTYKTLAKRYAGKKNKTIQSRISLAKSRTAQKKSVFSIPTKSKKWLETQPRKMGTQKRIRISKISFHSPIFMEKVRRQYEREQFQHELKQNLRVNPLPQLKKKKMQLHEYQRFLTQNSVPKHSPEPVPQKRLLSTKQNNKYIFSNQLSSSLKQACGQQLQFEMRSRRVKLNQTMHHFNRGQWICQEDNQNLGMLATGNVIETVVGGKLQVDEWMALVSKLKGKVKKLNWQHSELTRRHSIGLES